MKPLVPHRNEVFNEDNLQACLLRSTLQEFLDCIKKSNNELTPAGLIHVFQTLMFSRKASETKTHNNHGAGPRGNEHFLKIICLCISQSRANKFGQFKDDKNPSAELEMPRWLGTYDDGTAIVTPGIVLEMMKWKNEAGGCRDYYKRRSSIGSKKEVPNSRDEAYYAVDKGFELFKKVLHASREYAPMAFLRIFGYLFANWSTNPDFIVSPSSLSMVWEEDLERPLTDMSPVPTMKIFSDPGAHEFNDTAFEEFVSSRSDLVLNVTHDIPVRTSGSTARNNVVIEQKKLTRPVNFMRIALRFLYVYCVPRKTATENIVLSVHEKSAFVVFNIARAMRRLFLTRSSPSIRLPSADGSGPAGNNEADERVLHMQNDFLKTVNPSASNLERIVPSVLAIVSQKAFDEMKKKNKKKSSDGGNSDGAQGGAEDEEDRNGDVVEESAEAKEVSEMISEKLNKLAW